MNPMDQIQETGILSDWDIIEADVRTGLSAEYGKSKNIQDILDIIHNLQNEANTVTPLRELFNLHVTDKQNPHQVTVTLNDLDIMNTMYTIYNEKFGIEMTFGDFSYALVNIKRFATRADVDAKTNLDSIMNIDVMDYLIGNHNVSPEAHAELFRYKLPGVPPTSPPSIVYEPSIPISNFWTVDRACTINYHDINGRVKQAAINILPVDYSYGNPGSPIFGPHRNILTNSKTLTDASLHGGTRNLSSGLFIITPVDDTDFLLFQEDGTTGPHGFSDTVTEELTGVNNYSFYAYPLDRSQILVSILDSGTEIIGSVLFDCDKKLTQESGSIGSINVSILDLPNGWFRCVIAFDATLHNITGFDVDVLPLVNPDDNYSNLYQGENKNAMGFWQHQITKTALPTPPIFTDNVPVSVLGTKVRLEFGSSFNATHGSIMVKYLSPMSELFDIPNAIVRMGNNDNPYALTTSIEISSNPINSKRNRIISYNALNEILSLIDSDPYDSLNPTITKRIAFTYALGYQGYGFTNQRPIVFEISPDDVNAQMATFFSNIYDGNQGYVGTKILQLPEHIIADTANDNVVLIGGDLANTDQYRLNSQVNVLEIGYDSTTDLYLEGYLLNFRYYTVFSSELNLEFLLDQYIPTT